MRDVLSYLQCSCQETWSPIRSLALEQQQTHAAQTDGAGRWRSSRSAGGRLTVTAPLQVRDLQLQAGQHGQVLLLQEGDPSPHTGHLLLQVALIHGSVSAQGCWEAEGRFLLQEDRFEKRSACMFNFASPLEPQRLRVFMQASVFFIMCILLSLLSRLLLRKSRFSCIIPAPVLDAALWPTVVGEGKSRSCVLVTLRYVRP